MEPARDQSPAPDEAVASPGAKGADALPEASGVGDASELEYIKELGPSQLLATFLKSIPTLSEAERLEIIEKALVLVEGAYVHLSLKRAIYAVDPLQRLRLLRQRLKTTTDRGFHNEMIAVFNSLRDLHTLYILPDPYQGKLAFLPFLVEEFFARNEKNPRYLVSKVAEGLDGSDFRVGVEVTHWNGVPIGRAIELNADRQAGGNPDARRAQGVAELTVRPMTFTVTPDEDWVRVGYLGNGDQEKERQFPWLVIDEMSEMVSGTALARRAAASTTRMAWVGVDARGEAIRRARKVLFGPEAMVAERAVALRAPAHSAAARSGIDARTEATQRCKKVLFAPEAMAAERAARAAAPAAAPPGISTMPDNFRFRTVTDAQGRAYGYLRIFSFNFDLPYTDEYFVNEFRRIITQLLPQDGLIIDVRGNGGGVIPAGERPLQLLCPKRIEPERFHFKNSPLTLSFCEMLPAGFGLGVWKESIGLATETGELFSQGFPLTPVEQCNDIGQVYQGPVVLVIDAQCYSTTDIFTAGFQDHGIGQILGVSDRTGAGGANVWDYDEHLTRYFPEQFPKLPKGAKFTLAIRRSTRVGDKAGVPLEDLGVSVKPEDRHYMSRDDLLNGNRDLIARAVAMLAGQPSYTLAAEAIRSDGGTTKVKVRSSGVTRIDVYLDGRPVATRDIKAATTSLTLADVSPGPHTLKVQGFAGNQLVVVQTNPLA